LATSTYPLNGKASLKGKKIGLFIPCYIDLVYPDVGRCLSTGSSSASPLPALVST
jgi:hypothetical protein